VRFSEGRTVKFAEDLEDIVLLKGLLDPPISAERDVRLPAKLAIEVEGEREVADLAGTDRSRDEGRQEADRYRAQASRCARKVGARSEVEDATDLADLDDRVR